MTDSLSETGSQLLAPPATGAGEPHGLARLYMTSDLRAATGLPRTHLDYYLREGLILPTARTESGYLLFDDRELATLRTIIADRQAGLGIREIRERLGR
ncbi:MAG TPA: MerR family transcriptional regulator [Thermomicrobiales bacterium]|nr:MerR family transcriptional regulator [Thermomicrobiales bacterium]